MAFSRQLFVVFVVAVVGLERVSARDVPRHIKESFNNDELDWNIPSEIEAFQAGGINYMLSILFVII